MIDASTFVNVCEQNKNAIIRYDHESEKKERNTCWWDSKFERSTFPRLHVSAYCLLAITFLEAFTNCLRIIKVKKVWLFCWNCQAARRDGDRVHWHMLSKRLHGIDRSETSERIPSTMLKPFFARAKGSCLQIAICVYVISFLYRKLSNFAR